MLRFDTQLIELDARISRILRRSDCFRRTNQFLDRFASRCLTSAFRGARDPFQFKRLDIQASKAATAPAAEPFCATV
jgi:hypothetical protein